MNKKGDFEEFWVEYIAGAALLIAFYLAARGAYVGIAYIVAFLVGAVLGKTWYTIIKKKKPTVYISIFSLAILLGMIIGSIGADRRFIVILYLIGLLGSYVLFAKKWLR